MSENTCLYRHGKTYSSVQISDVNSTLWHPCVMCICFSIICFYLRIFRLESGFVRNSWILFCLIGAWGIGSAIGGFLLCIPPSNFWKMKDLDKCGSYIVFVLANGILEIFITIGILALPVRPVLKLSLSLRSRLSILAIFLLGAL